MREIEVMQILRKIASSMGVALFATTTFNVDATGENTGCQNKENTACVSGYCDPSTGLITPSIRLVVKGTSCATGWKKKGSLIINGHQSYISNSAVDYDVVGKQASSCGSCSASVATASSGLPTLSMQRKFRSRITQQARTSFGEGNSWADYDRLLTVQTNDSVNVDRNDHVDWYSRTYLSPSTGSFHPTAKSDLVSITFFDKNGHITRQKISYRFSVPPIRSN